MTNYAKLMPDFGLTAEQLDDKYNPDGDGEHPGFPRAMWRDWVDQRDTISGYWAWVSYMLRAAEYELDQDNPYNQEWKDDGDGDYTLNEKG